jgi:hypothetical protein
MNNNAYTRFYFDQKDSHSLEKNHTHFLLLDDGKYHSHDTSHELCEFAMSATNSQLESNRYHQQHQTGSMKANRKIVFCYFSSIYFSTEDFNNRDMVHLKLSSKQRRADFAKTTKYPKEMQRSDFVDHACREDKSESSFILLYLSDISFSKGYAVTIIVEGGINTCLAVLNDIQMKRPVIFIQVLVELYRQKLRRFFLILIRAVAKSLMS